MESAPVIGQATGGVARHTLTAFAPNPHSPPGSAVLPVKDRLSGVLLSRAGYASNHSLSSDGCVQAETRLEHPTEGEGKKREKTRGGG